MGSSPADSIIKTIGTMQDVSEKLRLQGKKIGFVPTMGFLHKGHESLIQKARTIADTVVVSIFVNPLQFGPGEDYSRYPRDFEHDRAVAEKFGTDIIFYPDPAEMFPGGFCSYIEVEKVSDALEGAVRSGHFKGVTTVVTKLFNIVKPHCVVFGQKDAQQAFIIRRIIKDLNFNIEFILSPIVREADGLALSSRNVYLNDNERKRASLLFQSLQLAAGMVHKDERSVIKIKKEMQAVLQSASPDQIDYIAFLNPSSFSEVEFVEPPETLVALAVRFGKTRLIDNIIIPVEK